MSRSPSREANLDTRFRWGPVRPIGKRRREWTLKRMVTLALVSVPVVACLAAALRMGSPPRPEKGESTAKINGRNAQTVVAVMRSAPLASEEEGGMPVDLLRYLDDPTSARAQTERVGLLYRRWTIRNALAAATSALANERLFDSTEPLRAVLEEWLTLEPAAAMGWVQAGSPNPGLVEWQGEAFAPALASMPVETRALWASRLPDDGGLVAKVAAEWVRTDAVAAVEWLAALAPGEGKREGLRALVAAWMDEDPAAAGGFVATLGPGTFRDLAVATVAETSPGGVAVEGETAEPGPYRATAAEAEKGSDWLVRSAGQGAAPKTLKRKPAD